MEDNKSTSNISTNVATSDEKLEPLMTPTLEIGDASSTTKKKKEKKKKVEEEYEADAIVEEEVEEEDKPPYKNMKARKIVLFIGFIICTLGFGLMAFSLGSLLVPNDFATIALFIPLDIAACAVSFVGSIFAVAGANTCKPIARLSFLFCTLGFILAAGMLVVMLITKLIPFELIQALLGK